MFKGSDELLLSSNVFFIRQGQLLNLEFDIIDFTSPALTGGLNEWLCTTLDSMVVQADGSNNLPTKLVPASEVPQLLRAQVYISGPPPGVPKFLTLVKAQNRGLRTDRWVLRTNSLPSKENCLFGAYIKNLVWL